MRSKFIIVASIAWIVVIGKLVSVTLVVKNNKNKSNESNVEGSFGVEEEQTTVEGSSSFGARDDRPPLEGQSSSGSDEEGPSSFGSREERTPLEGQTPPSDDSENGEVMTVVKTTDKTTITPPPTGRPTSSPTLLRPNTEKPTSTPNDSVFGGDSNENNRNPPDIFTKDSISIAYFGNSFTYFNACPFLLYKMLKTEYDTVNYVLCTETGADLGSLVYDQCPDWFTTDGSPNPQGWDFVILQDQSRWPAYPDTRSFTIEMLENFYAPLMFGDKDRTTTDQTIAEEFPVPVLMHTPAYKESGLFDSASLGNYDSFTDLVGEGYQTYADVLDKAAAAASGMDELEISRIAANGEAYRWLYHNNQELWTKLYKRDNYHPSESGTWLLACILYITMTGKEPPTYDPTGWGWQSSNNDAMPTEEDAEILRNVAMQTMGLSEQPANPMPVEPPASASPTISPTTTGDSTENDAPDVHTKDSISIAYFGDSIAYGNSCAWLLSKMLEMEYQTVEYIECSDEDANLPSLTYRSSECTNWFATDGSANPHEWDFVVLQDESRSPAYLDTRSYTMDSLETFYAPVFFGEEQRKSLNNTMSERFPIPVLGQTPAYKEFGLFGTEALGDFDSFTDLVAEGYQAYATVLDKAAAVASGIDDLEISRIAANGEAYRWLYHSDEELWGKLYKSDNYHPSEYGTWLLACTLYITMTGKEPPPFDASGWGWQSDQDVAMPTEDEAETLRKVAIQTMGQESGSDNAEQFDNRYFNSWT